MGNLLIIPQAWAERAEELPEAWLRGHGGALCRVWPDAPEFLNQVASDCGVSAKLLVTRMELEQGALSYGWDGSTPHYAHEGAFRHKSALRTAGIPEDAYQALTDRERWKLYYLCGVDKTGGGPREDGWFGPGRQLYGCGVRFTCAYRGRAVPSLVLFETGPLPADLVGVGESAAYAPGVPVTRGNTTIIPANQASADCLRYTSSMEAQRRLSEMGRRWWPEDYAREEGGASVGALTILIDPGHGARYKKDGRWVTDTGTSGGGVRECEVVMEVALAAKALLEAEGHTVRLSHPSVDYTNDLGPSARGRWAAAQEYDVFWSVHLDGSTKKSVRGTSVFFPTRGSVLSKELATAVAKRIREELGTPVSYSCCQPDGAGLHQPVAGKTDLDHPVSLGVFSGGDNYRKPGRLILTEAAFMSNATDLAFILADGFPKRYALAVCRGIYDCYGLPIPAAWGDSAVTPDEPDEPDEPTPGPTDWEKTLADAAAWAKERGISDGTRLDEPVTRGELLVMLRRAVGE